MVLVPPRSIRMLLLVGLLSLGLTVSCQTDTGDADKMPVTSTADDALEAYLAGRDLFEKLRFPDAREHFARAVELDPNFALAQLAMANTSSTANDFWQSLEKAVAASGNASEAERHWILAADAGARGDVDEQKAHLDALAAAFPRDERVHNLVGQYFFGRQDWATAVEHFKLATAINADFSPPYNQLGYGLRFMERYDDAEEAFKRYVELIPDEPNPYDSYAELLMKLGRHEESIAQYEKALEQDPNFIASYIGIGNNRIFMNQGDAAREAFAKLAEIARNDAERRQSLFWTASSFVHEGETDQALEALQDRYAIARETNDFPAMAGDHVLMGNVLLEAGRADEAMVQYQKALETMDASDAPQDTKDNFRRNHLYRAARVAEAGGDLATADEHAAAYGEQVAAKGIPFEVRRHHALLGMIALKRGDAATCLEHLGQANQQDPRVLYLQSLALADTGDVEAARAMCERAAHFNGLNFNYAYVRGPALAVLQEG